MKKLTTTWWHAHPLAFHATHPGRLARIVCISIFWQTIEFHFSAGDDHIIQAISSDNLACRVRIAFWQRAVKFVCKSKKNRIILHCITCLNPSESKIYAIMIDSLLCTSYSVICGAMMIVILAALIKEMTRRKKSQHNR